MTDENGPAATLELGKNPRQLCLHIAGHSWCHISWYTLWVVFVKIPLCYKTQALKHRIDSIGWRTAVTMMHRGTVVSYKPLAAQGHVAVSNEKQTTSATKGRTPIPSSHHSFLPVSWWVSLQKNKEWLFQLMMKHLEGSKYLQDEPSSCFCQHTGIAETSLWRKRSNGMLCAYPERKACPACFAGWFIRWNFQGRMKSSPPTA